MKLFSASIGDLQTLYFDSLQKALDMEQKITKALPTMIENASDPELSSAFSNHLEQTRGHVSRLETLLRNAGDEVNQSTCKVIGGLTAEAEDNIRNAKNPNIRDISLIASAQQVEHHEIAVYGTLRTWAEILGRDWDAATLESILTEEKEADELLSGIADHVNLQQAA
jgi:ferritin-like metal-binding protein YciE